MAQRRRTPGSKKGVSKPLKRQLDLNFPARLNDAMKIADKDVPALAKLAGCSRAVIHKYLKVGASKAIEAHLLFSLADALKVSARWLLSDGGKMAMPEALDPEQQRLLNLHSLMNPETRETWIEQGETLKRRQPSLIATAADPYRESPPAPVMSKR